MADKIKKLNLPAEVDSAGFEPFHRGDPADRRAVEVAARHGIDLSGHVARLFNARDFDRFDRIYVMDSLNYSDVISLARSGDDESKVDYILNLVDPGNDRHVPDPWYGGREGFENVYRMLDHACQRLAEEIKTNDESRQ